MRPLRGGRPRTEWGLLSVSVPRPYGHAYFLLFERLFVHCDALRRDAVLRLVGFWDGLGLGSGLDVVYQVCGRSYLHFMMHSFLNFFREIYLALHENGNVLQNFDTPDPCPQSTRSVTTTDLSPNRSNVDSHCIYRPLDVCLPAMATRFSMIIYSSHTSYDKPWREIEACASFICE